MIKRKFKNVKLDIFKLMSEHEKRFYSNLTEQEKSQYYSNVYNSVKKGYKLTSVFDWYNDKDLISWSEIGEKLGLRHEEVKKAYESGMAKIRQNLALKEYVEYK